LHQKHLVAGKRTVQREEPLGPLLSDDSIALLARRLFSSDNGPQRRLLRAELRARVRSALDKLSTTDREVLILRFMEQLSVEEIAALLGLQESAVKMRHLRALQKLRALLDESRDS